MGEPAAAAAAAAAALVVIKVVRCWVGQTSPTMPWTDTPKRAETKKDQRVM
jgi:hypothetical protein